MLFFRPVSALLAAVVIVHMAAAGGSGAKAPAA